MSIEIVVFEQLPKDVALADCDYQTLRRKSRLIDVNIILNKSRYLVYVMQPK